MGISAALAGGGFAIGTTANAAPAADSSTAVTQYHPARHCWWENGRRHHVWHDGWWDHRNHRWHHGWWSWESRPGRWHCS
ncbi:hypothetical protein [Saccharopolyspora sp. NPDC050642]|uniref:hypothetical protein n=1 Tax=Saccharopolyspora sp. NPDC050642 TaxID=3157099 RepID=UPI0033C33643